MADTNLPPAITASAGWREKGEPDPHGARYACERSQTMMGHLTDDQLANAVYLCDHRQSLESIHYLTAAKDRIRWLSRALERTGGTFQAQVAPWMLACFGAAIAADRTERNHRFLEEALELVQAAGCTRSEAHQLVEYVYGRPVGDTAQEVGGVMVTLAALCLAQGLDMHTAGETELARVWTKVEAIRAKQAAKPPHSPLPEATPSEVGQVDG